MGNIETRRTSPPPVRSGLVLPEGIEAGLIGGFGVVAVFLLRDASLGDPLHTPAVLGTLLLHGREAARQVVSAPGEAAFYHTVHFALWVVLGFAGSALMARAERSPSLRGLLLAAVAAAILALVGIGAWISTRGLIGPYLWLGGAVGLACMGAFLVWRHPGAVGRTRSAASP